MLYALAAYKFQEMQKNEPETAKEAEKFDNLAFESKEIEAKRNEIETVTADFWNFENSSRIALGRFNLLLFFSK